ncbi:MAG: anti-sigma factor [Mycobacteriaceae bacterium]
MSIDLHTLSGAYAIDALSPEEADEFEKHLAECQACRDEVRELQQAAATMGASEATAPPARLKARVLAAADRTPQQPPRVVAQAGTPRRWAPRLLAAAAAVVLVVAAGIGIATQLHHETAHLAAGVTQVFDQPDAHKATVRTSNSGKLTVATSKRLGEMAVDTASLRPLDTGHVYQLWSVTGRNTMASLGVVKDLARGRAMPIPGPGVKVAITVEPAGGSSQPTTSPIVAVDPSQV